MNTWKRLKNEWKLLLLTLLAVAVGLIASGFYNLSAAAETIPAEPQSQNMQEKEQAKSEGEKLMNNMINNQEVFRQAMSWAE